jgi:Xaa-Pro aminopeptidase
MVLAVEPGYYGSSGGIRIEDNIMVTQEGNKRLSKAPKELLEI